MISIDQSITLFLYSHEEIRHSRPSNRRPHPPLRMHRGGRGRRT